MATVLSGLTPIPSRNATLLNFQEAHHFFPYKGKNKGLSLSSVQRHIENLLTIPFVGSKALHLAFMLVII